MKCRLGDLARVSSSKRIYAKEYIANGIPFYRGKEIIELGSGRLLSNKLFISKDRFNQIKSKYNDVPEKDDVLITAVGTIGETYLVKSRDLPFYFKDGNLIKLSKWNRQIVLPEYMYYWLNSYAGKMAIKKITIGSTQQAITIRALSDVELDLPPISEQGKIAQGLSTLDFSIDNNKHINANLVELSNTIFKQILVSNDLHEFTINDIGTVAGGGTPSKKIISYWNGNIPWLSPKDLSNKPRIFTSSGENYITQQGLDNSSTKLLPRNTVLFSSRAPIGYLSIAKNRIATNQGFKSVIPNKQYPFWFIYELLKVETPRIINEANGSTFKEVSGSRLKQHIVYVPKSSDVLRYNSIFISLFQKMMQSESEIDTLNSLKRALLNKLF